MGEPCCLILAGGLATRMRPLTKDTPKAMIPACGKPFIDYQMEFLKSQGITELVLSIGYLGDQIRHHVQDGSRFGMQVRYSDEGESLRGTGGAVQFAHQQGLLTDPFVLMQGDSFLPIDVQAVLQSYSASQLPGLMTVFRNERRWEESNVIFEDGKVVNYLKGVKDDNRFQYVDYGMMVFSYQFVDKYLTADPPLDLAPPLHQLSIDGGLAGFEAAHRFYEIGSPTGLKDFTEYIESKVLSNGA